MKKIELVVEKGDLAGKRYTVPVGGLRLGRSSSNDIHVADGELSRNHCLFESAGDGEVKLTDLASANGTMLNGVALGADPAFLKGGDVIEIGSLVIRVVDSLASAEQGSVDLGLGASAKEDAGSASEAPRKRSPLANLLWVVAVAVVVASIGFMLLMPTASDEPAPTEIRVEEPKVSEVRYEKVEADLDGIFRYELAVFADGTIRVSIDDTKENRHPSIPTRKLDERALTELNDILDARAFGELEREYVGAEPDPPALNSWRLKVVYTTQAHTVRVVNTQEPEAFRVIREKLEAFSKNELGIHAIQYPRAKLVSLAEQSIELGRAKWEDRDVQHGNLAAAIAAFREAVFYLDTVEPKPACVKEARDGLAKASAELDKRYGDQRFLANRAINLGQWESAAKELKVLLEMIPDRADDRHREASAKLVDVEKRMKGDRK